MRKLAWVLLAATVLLGQTRAPQTSGGVAGRITSSRTGNGLGGARVILRADRLAPYVTETDEAGRFQMGKIAPGRYRLFAERSGYVRSEYRAGVEVKAGEVSADLDVRLERQAVIAGRVVDETGEPASGVTMTLLRPRYRNGVRELAAAGSAESDDRGQYRIFGIAAGRYFVSASNGNAGFYAAAGDVYATTYFPGSVHARDAAAVTVAAGDVTVGIDVQLVKSTSVAVRGRIDDRVGVSPAETLVLLFSGETGLPIGKRLQTAVPDKEGRFEFKGVTQGSYIVEGAASADPQGAQRGSGRRAIEVGYSDLEDVVVPIARAADVAGEIQVEGERRFPMDSLQVAPRTVGSGLPMIGMGRDRYWFGASRAVKVDGAGKFTLTGMDLDAVDLTVTGLPPEFYVKSIRLGDREMLGMPITFGGGGSAPVRIVVSSLGGRLDGTVSAGGSAAAGATVVLIPDAERFRSNEFCRSVQTDREGKFTLFGIMPGAYKVYAWEAVEAGAWLDEEFLKDYADWAQTVVFGEGERRTVELKAR